MDVRFKVEPDRFSLEDDRLDFKSSQIILKFKKLLIALMVGRENEISTHLAVEKTKHDLWVQNHL